MSQEILIPTKPINIDTSNRYAYSLPVADFNRYLFELKIKLKKKNKLILKIEDSKQSQLITQSDQIKFNDIKNFNMKVYVLPYDNIQDLELEGRIDKNTNNFTRSTNKLYLEFIRTNSEYVECNCNVIFTDTFKYSISPPF